MAKHYFTAQTLPAVRQHVGWQSVRWQGKRYQLFGMIRGQAFIDLSLPL
jgi:hypothetical protein